MKNDIESTFPAHDARTRATALRAFNTRKRKKQIASTLPLLLVIITTVWIRNWDRPVPRIPAPVAVVRTPPPKRDLEAGLINDEQLLASFPPGSCYLAEVNGAKSLFFYDPKVKAKFFN